jgi:hypothetical protein
MVTQITLFRLASDLRNHQAIVQPRCLMVTQITLIADFELLTEMNYPTAKTAAGA